MTTDRTAPASTAPDGADKDPTDPPLHREAATPEEIEESKKQDEKSEG